MTDEMSAFVYSFCGDEIISRVLPRSIALPPCMTMTESRDAFCSAEAHLAAQRVEVKLRAFAHEAAKCVPNGALYRSARVKRRRCVLKYHLHIPLVGNAPLRAEPTSVKDNFARVGLLKTRYEAQERALSAAGGADNAEYLAVVHLKVHTAHGAYAARAAVAFAQAFDAEYAFHA